VQACRITNFGSDPLRSRPLVAALVAVFFLVSCGNRATPAPKPQPPPPFEFLGAWGEKGDGPGKLNTPVAFAGDTLGNVFFVDSAESFIHKFQSNGTPLLSFEDWRVRHAAGIAVDTGGAIYAADAERGSIIIFFPDGSFLQSWRCAPQRHFSGPVGISTDEQGNLYVPEAAKSRILKINSRGRLVKSWAAPNTAVSPDERPSSVVAAPDGTVLVAYFQTGRIERFASDGSSMTSWTATSSPNGATIPIAGFAVGAGHVFTLAASSADIRVWAMDGQQRLQDDLSPYIGQIGAPQIAVTPRAELLVFDPSAPKVFRFRIHLDNPGFK
jgi:hypothetical protein